ncbi:thiol:disulfide interchange protein DsbD [Alteromonas halophila]|uniref:Thiol:disulfide interchange protein DsbD n=2 Tax=Alteromonas halophila TaxID=516698 RepID=A0A918JMD7_9ALTE|nr:thiol:disulfide interchange protein DsbD [Alteromonas halophila]
MCWHALAKTSADSSISAPHIQVSLVSEDSALVPGTTQLVGVRIEPDPHWHTYWQNPGDSGEAPKITWQQTDGMSFGEIQWPLPQAIRVAHLVNYGYADAHLLMVPVTVDKQIQPGGERTLTADLSYLVCKENCIPGWATLSLTLPVASDSAPSASAQLFTKAREALPAADTLPAAFEVTDSHIAVSVNGLSSEDWTLFPLRSDVASHSSNQQILYENGQLHALIQQSDYFTGAQDTLEFLISDGTQGYYLKARPAAPIDSVTGSETLGVSDLAIYAGMALLGGLILNIMPCVLPILSIKALSLQQHAKPGHHWAYLLGILVCFNAFTVTIISLQVSGQQLGWGFHLQSPLVIAALAFLFTFIGLSLLDVVAVGPGLSGMGQSLVSGNNHRSHFFTGVLAVIVASPCTAPFMAAALGVALVQPPVIALFIFNALAVGFALPMMLLFIFPSLRKKLPAPGPWMNVFKQALAFPMFATAAWLCWVYAGQAGTSAQFVLLCALLGFAFLLWLKATLPDKLTVTVLSVSGCLAIFSLITVLSLQPPTKVDKESASSTPYTAQTLASLRAKDQVVLVNMTADWCITCKVNEQVALSTRKVQDVLASDNIHYLVGDWTNKNDEIYTYLKQYERAGVPLYVVYGPDNFVKVLPQVLTPDIVVTAINQALQEQNHAS